MLLLYNIKEIHLLSESMYFLINVNYSPIRAFSMLHSAKVGFIKSNAKTDRTYCQLLLEPCWHCEASVQTRPSKYCRRCYIIFSPGSTLYPTSQ